MDSRAVWGSFREGAAERDARLLSELRTAGAALQQLVAALLDDAAQVAADRPEGRTLDALGRLYETHAPAVLLGPADAFQRQRPQRRALEAFDDYDRTLDQSIRLLPDTLAASGAELTDLIGTSHLGVLTRTRLRWRRAAADIPLRSTLLLEARLHRARRRPIEGRLLAALGELGLELVVPWQALRRIWFAPTLGEPAGVRLEAELARIRGRMVEQCRRAEQAIGEIEAWQARAPGGAARRLARGRVPRADRVDKLTARDDRRREFLGRQARAVDADIDLAARLARAEQALLAAAGDVRAAVEAEHQELLRELHGVVEWLDAWRPGDPATFPPAVARIVSAASRIRALSRAADGILLQVPASIEVSAQLSAAPRVRRSWTIQTPRDTLQGAIASLALPTIGTGMGVLERQHQGMVLEIERAREVVGFASDTARASGRPDPRIEKEGIENARSLLEFHHQQAEALPADVERSLVTGLVQAFDRTHRVLDEGQFGVWRQAARYGTPRAAQLLWRRSGRQAAAGADALSRLAVRGYRSALVGIGWIPAPPVATRHVVARGYLTRTLGGEAKMERLPLIYQRLFRLVPIEDPRFLIGRQEELAAIADARQLWEQQRDAAVLLVGARGSGKTSLLNCAAQTTLAGLPMVRSEFRERLKSRGEMDAFLGQMLGVAPEAVEQDLARTRRVIVLEEMERTFLRVSHGYEAVRTLLGLISRTSRHALWIVSVNYSCFRLLNAALRLEPHFSHQINAMAVDPPHLREAILMRHNLSGLRLRFAPPLDQDSYAYRLRQAAGMPVDAESDFFDALYRESGGVFRTAFALWQRYIDRAEAGVLYMRPPSSGQYDEVVGALDTLDLFTLAALLQHGSLTPREHSLVFQIDETRSRSWLDNLLARELIEPDPGRYGLRVVPEAAQIVRQTLFRRNLA